MTAGRLLVDSPGEILVACIRRSDLRHFLRNAGNNVFHFCCFAATKIHALNVFVLALTFVAFHRCCARNTLVINLKAESSQLEG